MPGLVVTEATAPYSSRIRDNVQNPVCLGISVISDRDTRNTGTGVRPRDNALTRRREIFQPMDRIPSR